MLGDLPHGGAYEVAFVARQGLPSTALLSEHTAGATVLVDRRLAADRVDAEALALRHGLVRTGSWVREYDRDFAPLSPLGVAGP